MDHLALLVLLGQTGTSALQESKALLEFEGRLEPLDFKERVDLQAQQAVLERRESLERMVLRVLMGLLDLLAPQDSEALWVSLDSEEREACWDCQVLLVHQENLEHLELRAAKGLLVELVYQEPPGQEEMLAQRVLLEQRGLLVMMVL